MNLSLLLTFLTCALILRPADTAGKVDGTLTLNKQPVTLKYAYAHFHDNAERLLDRPKELRILLTDREAPAGSLNGIAFPPVWDLAMQGKVRGLLIEVDPADTQKASVVLLDKPAQPGQTLTTLTLSKTGTKLFEAWSYDGKTVKGSLEESSPSGGETGEASFSVQFEAPVTKEPAVTATLTGAEAANSPQVKLLRLRADAMVRGDLAALRKLATRRAAQRIDALPPEVVNQLKAAGKQEGMQEKKRLAKPLRVVVRGDRAIVLVTKNEWATLAKEDGQWKSDD